MDSEKLASEFSFIINGQKNFLKKVGIAFSEIVIYREFCENNTGYKELEEQMRVFETRLSDYRSRIETFLGKDHGKMEPDELMKEIVALDNEGLIETLRGYASYSQCIQLGFHILACKQHGSQVWKKKK